MDILYKLSSTYKVYIVYKVYSAYAITSINKTYKLIIARMLIIPSEVFVQQIYKPPTLFMVVIEIVKCLSSFYL